MYRSIILIIVGLGLVIYGMHRLATWAEKRGWIYYRNSPGSLGPYGRALIEATSMFAPEIEHVLEEEQSEKTRADQAKSGDTGDDHDSLRGSVDFD